MAKEIATNQSFEGAGGSSKFPDLDFITMIECESPKGGPNAWKSILDANTSLLRDAQEIDGISSASVFGIEYVSVDNDTLARAYGNVYAKRES